MKFQEFIIKNYKGIESISFNLERAPEANIFTLVGLNESGKTTILEAINFFITDKGLGIPSLTNDEKQDINSFIPISLRDNFNGEIEIKVILKLDEDDLQRINEFVEKSTSFQKVETVESIFYHRKYVFKDSKFSKLNSLWSGFNGLLKNSPSEEYKRIATTHNNENYKIATFCDKLIPSILYFPNFLFDIPSRIYLETKEKPSAKEKFYIDLVQDILYSLDNETNINSHIIERIKSTEVSDKRSLNSLIQKMERKVTDTIFEAWNRIFKRVIKDAKIVINYDLDADNFPFLEFEIESPEGIYQINERSLGFRWFFIFLLFTQFRPYRKNTPKNIIFLFDEPASNLHTSAQKQLLKSFENLSKNTKIIYTTHSHHMINPNWLESTYVVRNTGLNLDTPENYTINKTNISIIPYREFVTKHPHNTAYFQPILDVLDYVPSNLEMLPNCIFVEGKNDFYTLEYFRSVLFSEFNDLNISPSTGSGNLDTLISLYLGWGRKFIILLDSDKEGLKQKQRYINKYGILVEQRIFTLKDIHASWDNKTLEMIFSVEEKLNFQKTFYSDSEIYNKTHFNRSLQEGLITKTMFIFNDETIANFKSILIFIREKIAT